MSKETSKRIDNRNAAHLLMTKFVEREANFIAMALEYIIPLRDEVTYERFEKDMSVVNQTFASLALQVISHNSSLDDEDPDVMYLPVGAKEMRDTLEELSKFIHSVRHLLFFLYDNYRDDVAVKMADEIFSEFDPQM